MSLPNAPSNACGECGAKLPEHDVWCSKRGDGKQQEARLSREQCRELIAAADTLHDSTLDRQYREQELILLVEAHLAARQASQPSRSVQRRVALQKGEKMPTFEPSHDSGECELYYHRPASKRPNLPADQLRKLDADKVCTCGHGEPGQLRGETYDPTTQLGRTLRRALQAEEAAEKFQLERNTAFQRGQQAMAEKAAQLVLSDSECTYAHPDYVASRIRSLAGAEQQQQPVSTMPSELEALYKLHKDMEIDGLRSHAPRLWTLLENLHLWLRRTVGDLRAVEPSKNALSSKIVDMERCYVLTGDEKLRVRLQAVERVIEGL